MVFIPNIISQLLLDDDDFWQCQSHVELIKCFASVPRRDGVYLET